MLMSHLYTDDESPGAPTLTHLPQAKPKLHILCDSLLPCIGDSSDWPAVSVCWDTVGYLLIIADYLRTLGHHSADYSQYIKGEKQGVAASCLLLRRMLGHAVLLHPIGEWGVLSKASFQAPGD